MLRRRREQLVMAGTFLLQEGIARGELPRWLDAGAVARAYIALLDGMLLVRAEQGEAFRRADAERAAREILALLLGAVAAPERPSIPEVEARPYSILASPGTSREQGSAA
jgi:hypothetical protein